MMNISLWNSNHIFYTIIDLGLIYLLVYYLLLLLRGTKAFSLLNGFVLLLFVTEFSRRMGLNAFSWVLDKASTMLLVALPIVFQPELRRTLEELGNRRFLYQLFSKKQQQVKFFSMIKEAVEWLSDKHIGGLIVLAGEDPLTDVIENGIRLDAAVSPELIISIFHPKTPLHDGAIIIRKGRIAAAKCILPLSQDKITATKCGTRHLAALGLSEQSDATVIVISEESGVISVARYGELVRYIPAQNLPQYLMDISKQVRKEGGKGVGLPSATARP